VFHPHGGEGLLDVFEVQKESEEELVPEYCLARYHEGKRELDGVVEG
jgi:hypothetical protein